MQKYLLVFLLVLFIALYFVNSKTRTKMKKKKRRVIEKMREQNQGAREDEEGE